MPGHCPPWPRPHLACPGATGAVRRAMLPRKLGRGLGNVSPTPDLRRRSRPSLRYRENRFPEVPRQSVGRSAGRWVCLGTSLPVASEGVWARADGAMVGPDPAGGSEAPSAEAKSWDSWTGGAVPGGRGSRCGHRLRPCGVLVQFEFGRRRWDLGVRVVWGSRTRR